MVYKLDFMNLDSASVFNVSLKNEAGDVCVFASLVPGRGFMYADRIEQIGIGDWHEFAIIINSKTMVVDYYFDGVKTAQTRLTNDMISGAPFSAFRIHATVYTLAGKSAETSDPVEFFIDNVCVYEGDKLTDKLPEAKKVIRMSSNSIFPDENYEKSMLNGCFAVHTRSGIAYDGNGEKFYLENKPFIQNGVYMVYAQELDRCFSVKSSLSGYVSLYDYANAVHKKIIDVPSDVNSGLWIMSDNGFSIPSDRDVVQKLNDFVYNLRPDSDYILNLYRDSEYYGQHPRIHAGIEDFEEIIIKSKTDDTIAYWVNMIIAKADNLIGRQPVKYELRDGVRLLSVSCEVLENMYTLGMAYRLTGDKKYADQAWVDLYAVCNDFPDWHPIHDIDLGEMSAAVAIGYDWMYDAFTRQQRQIIQRGIYRNSLYDGIMGFQYTTSPMGGYALLPDNHNVVSNGGMTMLALAFMDTYPKECAYIVSNAVRAVDNMLYKFAPDGAWYEGPHYWEYTMQYTAKMISSLESTLGTSLGLDTCEGLDTSAEYMIYMQSSQGIYNYGDGIQLSVYPPELIWLSEKYDNGISGNLLKMIDRKFPNAEDYALALLWYEEGDEAESYSLELDKLYSGENTLVMRKSWTDKDSSFVGIHGGYSNISHSQLDGGSFIFDHSNVRWAMDLGMNNYNVSGYWDVEGDDAKRWEYFRSRAESHNTLVVNPGSQSDHYTDSYAEVRLISSSENGAFATVDMSELLHNVSAAKRGFAYVDNRNSLVIRDEINLSKYTDVYWFMITEADVVCDSTGATLTQDGKKLRLDFVSSSNATISCETAKPLPTSPDPVGNSTETAKRIAIHFKTRGIADLTVKLTPLDVDGTDITIYDIDIDKWSQIIS